MTGGFPGGGNDVGLARHASRGCRWVASSTLCHQSRPERFQYSNAGAHLVAPVLERATGETVLDYAREKLFGPLGIDTRRAFEPVASPPEQRLPGGRVRLAGRPGRHARRLGPAQAATCGHDAPRRARSQPGLLRRATDRAPPTGSGSHTAQQVDAAGTSSPPATATSGGSPRSGTRPPTSRRLRGPADRGAPGAGRRGGAQHRDRPGRTGDRRAAARRRHQPGRRDVIAPALD